MFQRLCKKKVSGTGDRKDNALGFLDVVDEFMDDDYEEESPEEQEESESDSLEDYETDPEENADSRDGLLKVNCDPTNGSVVIIKDLISWLKSPYIEI